MREFNCREYPTVSILVPAHNEEKFIGRCLESLLAQDYPKDRFEIIVVNNKSTDDTAKIVSSYSAQLIDFDGNGMGAVRNFAANHSKGDYLAFVDADCIVPRNWVSTAIESFRSQSADCGAIGGDALMSDEPSNLEKSWFFQAKRRNSDMKYLNGACMFFSRKVFEKVGGFDSTINAGEDTDFSNRVKSSGRCIKWVPSLDVIHLGYPKTLREFCKRQFWLASSYAYSKNGIHDYVFILTCIFLFSILNLIIGLLFGVKELAFASIIGLSAGPFLLYLKKIRRTNISILSKQSFNILFLSFSYFASRSAGLIFSLTGKRFSRRKRC